MSFRISPLWWPALIAASPMIVPGLWMRNRRFRQNQIQAKDSNHQRITQATPVELPELNAFELTVLVEWEAAPGFLGDAGVSYRMKTDRGALLYDVGFGPTRPALTHNAAQFGFSLNDVDALVISHLHGDHLGGMNGQRLRRVCVPKHLMAAEVKPCFLPDRAEAPGFRAEIVSSPRVLAAGIASIGPLARSLFLFGYTEEQALLARLKGKGLVLFTGCGHPTIEAIITMVRRLSDEPFYAIGGGLHFPITGGRGNRAGIQFQTIIGTGKPPWQRITDEDLSQTIAALNAAGPQNVFLSAHDTCDHALKRLKRELKADTRVLQAGATYQL